MNTVHLDFIRDNLAIARWYDGDGQEGFNSHLPFKAVATLLWLKNIVEIHGMHGVMTRSMRQDLKSLLLERGIEKALAYRHGSWVDLGQKKERSLAPAV